MNVALITSNYIRIDSNTKKGTEIFFYAFANSLKKMASNDFSFQAFCSEDSDLPFPITGIGPTQISDDDTLPQEKKVIFELALISQALQKQSEFDLFHFHIGDGDLALPFAPFVRKPILITIHHAFEKQYVSKYFSLFKDLPHVFFVSISDYQRKLFPDIQFTQTICNGVDLSTFTFNPDGGENMMWAGRAIPEKGPDTVIDVAESTNHQATLFGIPKSEYEEWFQTNILGKLQATNHLFIAGRDRFQLIPEFQKSKLFLFPVRYEESFGLVLIEAMSCGTPVIAYAKGSIPEIIQDGVTGFIVNESEDDIRGNWIVRKTGIEGLKEAVERIYSLPSDEYKQMRRACREHTEKNFSIETMTQSYLQLYKRLIS